MGITLFNPRPADVQILSARYTMPAVPARDAKSRLAGLIAAHGFASLEVSDWVCDHPLVMDHHSSSSLGLALGSTTVAGASLPIPWGTGSIAAELSEDQGTLTVEYIYKGKLCRKRADYGTFLFLP